jgi:hypothetical protein
MKPRPWRVGRTDRRRIYEQAGDVPDRNDRAIGMMNRAEDACFAVMAHNALISMLDTMVISARVDYVAHD